MGIENRKLTPAEYFKQLQIEYIATKVRLAIYTAEKDLQYYEKVLQQKKQDIEGLAIRNGFTKTVANDIDKFNIYALDFLENGFPKFVYYSKRKNQLVFEKLDFFKYYSKNDWFLIDGTKKCKVVYSDFENKTILVSIKINKKIHKEVVDYKRVKRQNFVLCF